MLHFNSHISNQFVAGVTSYVVHPVDKVVFTLEYRYTEVLLSYYIDKTNITLVNFTEELTLH